MGDWFAVRTLEPGVHVIAEPYHVNSYLLEGKDSRVHIDTGLGVADIRAAGDALSPRSPVAANTHHHFDHVGGNALFEGIAIHELGVAALAAGHSAGELDGYREWAKRMIAQWPTYRELDDRYFLTQDDISTLRPWPDGFDFDEWTVRASRATRPLHDGDVLDLGGTRLRVIHTPGHTDDSVCFLDEDRGLLFTGDTVNSGPILVTDGESASLEDFARSTRRLADEVAPSVRAVYMAHGVRFQAEPGYLRDVAEGFERVLAGDVVIERERAEFEGGVVDIARFPRFSIALPDDSERSARQT